MPFADKALRAARGFYTEKAGKRFARGVNPFEWLWNILSNIVNSHKPWVEYVDHSPCVVISAASFSQMAPNVLLFFPSSDLKIVLMPISSGSHRCSVAGAGAA